MRNMNDDKYMEYLPPQNTPPCLSGKSVIASLLLCVIFSGCATTRNESLIKETGDYRIYNVSVYHVRPVVGRESGYCPKCHKYVKGTSVCLNCYTAFRKVARLEEWREVHLLTRRPSRLACLAKDDDSSLVRTEAITTLLDVSNKELGPGLIPENITYKLRWDDKDRAVMASLGQLVLDIYRHNTAAVVRVKAIDLIPNDEKVLAEIAKTDDCEQVTFIAIEKLAYLADRHRKGTKTYATCMNEWVPSLNTLADVAKTASSAAAREEALRRLKQDAHHCMDPASRKDYCLMFDAIASNTTDPTIRDEAVHATDDCSFGTVK